MRIFNFIVVVSFVVVSQSLRARLPVADGAVVTVEDGLRRVSPTGSYRRAGQASVADGAVVTTAEGPRRMG